MVTSSKILTVTYGTFSCTLEGFDDPFTTLQKVAEYFRKLAAADRYFGGTPQTPDTETLRQIAEANSAGPINAEISEHGITLRQSAEAPPVPFDVGQAEADESADVAEDTTPDAVDTPEPVHFFRSRRAEHDSDPEILAEVVIEPEVEPEAEAAVAPMPEPVAEVTPEEEAMPESEAASASEPELEAAPEPEPVSVATPEPETTPEPEAVSEPEEATEQDDISRVVAGIAAATGTGAAIRAAAPARDVEQTLAAIRQNVQQAQSEIAASDQSQAEATPETDEAEPEVIAEAEPAETEAENVIAADSEAEAEPDNLFVEETVAEPEMTEPEAVAPVEAKAVAAELPGSETVEAEMAEPADIAPVEAETAEAEPYEVETVAAAKADVEVAEAPASVEAELEAEIAETLIKAEAEEVVAETPVPIEAPAEAHAETPETAPEAETFEAPQQANMPAEEEGVEAVAEAEPTPASTLSEEDEADLARQLAAAMDLDAGNDAETPDETQWRAERRRRASALREMAAPTNGNGALDRLLHTAQVQMDHPEQQRRVNALDQLKAAVAATEADAEHRRKTPEKTGETESEDATEMESFRRDFRQVQSRAGLARLSGGGEHRPASPLILVSEQRIDEPVSDDAPMREMAESHGNLALKPRMVSTPAAMDDGDDDEIQGIPSDAFSGAENFEDFVERVGVFEMTELLEAAAAYTSIVEREDRFSRASVMSKIAMLNHGEGYSKEAGLRAFGKLLREGKILRVQDGQFAISKASRYSVASRYES